MLTPAELMAIFDQATEETIELMQDEGFWKVTPKLINGGFCGYWADFALTHIQQKEGEAHLLFSIDYSVALPSHTWLYYEGKHYDAECLDGVTDFMQLPIFTRF